MGNSALRNEREVGRLDPDCAKTGSVVRYSGILIAIEAEDRHGSAPFGGVATDSFLERSPAGRVELQLQEGGSGVSANVIRRGRVGAIEDVRVAIRDAGRIRKFRGGLVVAQCHPKPKGNVQLEVEGSAGPILGGQGGGIGGQSKLVYIVIAGARGI